MFYEVIIESGETANKCTIAPLYSRPDFQLIRAPATGPLGPLTASILLHHEGQCLTQIRQSQVVRGIAGIDCVWSRLGGIIERIAVNETTGDLPLLASIPAGFKTAYPRQSIFGTDPKSGLATIEALFVASALLGNWDASLLSKYYFGREFVKKNRESFLDLGVLQVADERNFPTHTRSPKNSLQRRKDRRRLVWD